MRWVKSHRFDPRALRLADEHYSRQKPAVPGMVSFVDAEKTRRKRDPGRCFVKAGFRRLKQRTQSGLVVLQLAPEDFPAAEPAGAHPYTLNLEIA